MPLPRMTIALCLTVVICGCHSRVLQNTSGRSVLPKPTVGELPWQVTPPSGFPQQEDRQDLSRVHIRMRNHNVPPPKSPPTSPITANSPQKGDPPVIFENVKVTTGGTSGRPEVLEPVSANHGNAIVYSGNFLDLGISTDGGKSWSFKAPRFNNSDNDVLYAPQINEFIWYQQGGNPNYIVLVDGDNPLNLTKSCTYPLPLNAVNPTWISQTPNRYWFDFPALSLGNNFFYLTANVIDNGGGGNLGTVIVRFDLASFKSACFSGGTATLDWYLSAKSDDGFYGIGMAQGSASLAGTGLSVLFASHLHNDQLRVYSWPESSDHTGVTFTDVSHTAYKPPNFDQICLVPDGGNPCYNLGGQPGFITGWADQATDTVSFMWNAGATPPYNFPYLHIVTVNAFPGQISLRGESQVWNPNYAVLNGGAGVNSLGKPAVTAFVAGGSVSPSPIMLLPTEGLSYVQLSTGNASNVGVKGSWGDYLRPRPYIPAPGASGQGWNLASYFYPSTSGPPNFQYYQVSGDQDMDLAVSVAPTSGSVNAGYNTAAAVTVTSLNGIQTGPITMRVDGLSGGFINIATEDLTGQTCTFPTPVQVGSTCQLIMDLNTVATAPQGTYTLNVWAQPTTYWAQPAAGAIYSLTIGSSIAPSPNIVTPRSGASLTAGATYPMIGWARSTDQAELSGFVPCTRMSFTATDAGGGKQILTTIPDPNFQQLGYCEAQGQLNAVGPANITLNATNIAGVVGQASVALNIVEHQTGPFVFGITSQQSASEVIQGGSAPFNLTVSAVSGTPEPIELSASGLPAGATATFSPNPITPTAAATLTIMTTPSAPTGTFNIIITGRGVPMGTVASTNVNLYVEAPLQ